jgi:hypothetical protein
MTEKGPMFFRDMPGGVRMAVADTVTAPEVHDVRFPTSEQLDGSGAMYPDPDHSAVYVLLVAAHSHPDGPVWRARRHHRPPHAHGRPTGPDEQEITV